MNETRRNILILALIAFAASLFFAPFRYFGHVGIGGSERTSGTVFRPIGSPPKHYEIVSSTAAGSTFVDASELDTGGLGLMWAAICVGAGVAMLLTGPRSSPTRRCQQCAETIQMAARKCRFCGADVSAP